MDSEKKSGRGGRRAGAGGKGWARLGSEPLTQKDAIMVIFPNALYEMIMRKSEELGFENKKAGAFSAGLRGLLKDLAELKGMDLDELEEKGKARRATERAEKAERAALKETAPPRKRAAP